MMSNLMFTNMNNSGQGCSLENFILSPKDVTLVLRNSDFVLENLQYNYNQEHFTAHNIYNNFVYDEKHIAETVEKINEELSVPLDNMPPVTISVGVAFWDRPNPSADILKDSDTALLQLKKTRSANCCVYGT